MSALQHKIYWEARELGKRHRDAGIFDCPFAWQQADADAVGLGEICHLQRQGWLAGFNTQLAAPGRD